MNYTIKEARKIRVGDTLTLEDGSVHEAVKDGRKYIECKDCSIFNPCMGSNIIRGIKCGGIECFHFKQTNPWHQKRKQTIW